MNIKSKSKKILFVSENRNKELFCSIKMALDAVASINVVEQNGSNKIEEGEVIIINDIPHNEKNQRKLCEIRKKYCNPIIWLTEQTNIVFERNLFASAFLNCTMAHKYISIPFQLNDLIRSISSSEPLSEKEKEEIYENYFGWKKLIKPLIDHDLKKYLSDLKSVDKSIEKFEMIKYILPKGFASMKKCINKKIGEIKVLSNGDDKLGEIYISFRDYIKRSIKDLFDETEYNG